MGELRTDITVVGGGVAGLWSAKELIDQGFTVDLIERADCLATGATTRNEGWLHAGTYHSVAVYDEIDAENVTERTIYGHDAIVNFAPESVEHGPTFAFIAEDELAHSALQRWDKFGILYRERPVRQFEAEGFDVGKIRAAFEVKDKSVNSRVICDKLARYITDNGGRIFTGADFRPTGDSTADLEIDGKVHKIVSGLFVVAAGTGTKKVFEDLTGNMFPMRYFKSHLLVTPRLTEDNYFYIDPLEAGIMSHGGASIVGINREAVELPTPDYEVIPATERAVYDSMVRMLPRSARYALGSSEVMGVACVKADVSDGFKQENTDPTIVLQDLNIKVFEPTPNYVCAIPGKMTEAPALAQAVVGYVVGKGLVATGNVAERGLRLAPEPLPVNLRPADRWMAAPPSTAAAA